MIVVVAVDVLFLAIRVSVRRLAALETVFPNQHRQSSQRAPDPTFRCWLMMPFNSSRGVISWFRHLWRVRKGMRSGRVREERSDKCAGQIMNMKMFCDPGAELFRPTLMPNATLVSSPEAVRAPISAPWPRIKWETPEEESVPVGLASGGGSLARGRGRLRKPLCPGSIWFVTPLFFPTLTGCFGEGGADLARLHN